MYTIREAAEALGISVSTIKWHIYYRPGQTGEEPLLSGQIKGNTMIFTESDLDKFRARISRPGRKTKYSPPPIVRDGRYQCPGCDMIYSRQWFKRHIEDCEAYQRIKSELESD